MKKLTHNFIVKRANYLVDKIIVRLFPSDVLPEKVDNGPLIFHKNGNVSLNYKDDQVKSNIKKHMQSLEGITLGKS